MNKFSKYVGVFLAVETHIESLLAELIALEFQLDVHILARK